MGNASVADSIVASLQLDSPPIALAFTDSPPEGVPVLDERHPSACSFWRRAESQVFFAPAESHFNCPIGAMVMGFDLPAQVQQELSDVVGTMVGVNYIGADEPTHLPSVKKAKGGIVYGPLGQLPVESDVDVVVIWMTPKQAMLFNEAIGSARWSGGTPAPTLGRPGCTAIAVASTSSPAVSMGCIGMRTFTEISDDRMLVAVPGAQVIELADALERTMDANRTMEAAYQEKAAALRTG